MKKFLGFIGRRLLESFYFILGFPIVVGLFVLLTAAWSFLFVPFLAVFILVLLQAMESVAKFEVNRANWFLRKQIQVIDNWFSYRLFSWAGVRERLSSARSWLALAYVLLSFFIGVLAIGFSLTTVVMILVTIAFPVGILISWLSGSLVVNTEVVEAGELGLIRVGDQAVLLLPGFLVDLPLPVAIAFATLLILVATVALGGIVSLFARLQGKLVQAFLSNGLVPAISSLSDLKSEKLKVNEKEIRNALESPKARESLADLTPRELEILGLMAQGKSNSGIASLLFITEGSVEKHVSNILQKMNLTIQVDNHRRVLAVLEYLGIQPGSLDVSRAEKERA